MANRGVGMPGWIILCDFGEQVRLTFGAIPYLVGSAWDNREPHDIDVRLILSDAEFERRIGPLETQGHTGTAWAMHCLVWSLYGTRLLGKPMDFQIQSQTAANEYHGQPRNPLFNHSWLNKKEEEPT